MEREPGVRIIDIALEAGVSTATVDRVLNSRGGVSPATTAEVGRAIATLGARRARRPLASTEPLYAFDAVLPAGAGPSTEYLGSALHTAAVQRNATVACTFVEKMNPGALAARLVECATQGSDGVAFQALDHPLVRDAVARLAERGVPTVTLMSDLGGAEVAGFVGTDNRAAGRTAGFLMGRFVRRSGLIAVVWGGQLYRSHEEREIGFRSLLRAEFPDLRMRDVIAGQDDVEGNYREVQALLREDVDLVGIYSVGGGNRGIVRALREGGREREVVLIGHNLTPTTQTYLLEGSMDAVIHQDMRRAAQMAVATLIDQRERRPISVRRLPVEVIVKENLVGRVPPGRHGIED